MFCVPDKLGVLQFTKEPKQNTQWISRVHLHKIICFPVVVLISMPVNQI